jgi:hypothetical protein
MDNKSECHKGVYLNREVVEYLIKEVVCIAKANIQLANYIDCEVHRSIGIRTEELAHYLNENVNKCPLIK